ncbi:hypothetical protein BDZ85DRAFT_258222 [Elsinoe ampelina]|uniref:Uncharacterized protein n=1 Tax=Elsinoe ampelina TaxID=302913 RepID=A0A6A6GJE4_9PEZI|nr:hypothetical protein BDZ85DRAFT_258222 [Elsinoe ampelina]
MLSPPAIRSPSGLPSSLFLPQDDLLLISHHLLLLLATVLGPVWQGDSASFRSIILVLSLGSLASILQVPNQRLSANSPPRPPPPPPIRSPAQNSLFLELPST